MLSYQIVTRRFLTSDIQLPFTASNKVIEFTKNIHEILSSVIFQDKNEKYCIIFNTVTKEELNGNYDKDKDKLVNLLCRGKKMFTFENILGIIVKGNNDVKIPVIFTTIDEGIRVIVPRSRLIDLKSALGADEIKYQGEYEAVGSKGYNFIFKETE